MSNNTPGPEFWNRVNALINFVNDQCDSADPSEVGASTMYADDAIQCLHRRASHGQPGEHEA
jgi:hypothetical protein